MKIQETYQMLQSLRKNMSGKSNIPGTFSVIFTPDIDFTDEAVAQCVVPFVKSTFADDWKYVIQMIDNR